MHQTLTLAVLALLASLAASKAIIPWPLHPLSNPDKDELKGLVNLYANPVFNASAAVPAGVPAHAVKPTHVFHGRCDRKCKDYDFDAFTVSGGEWLLKHSARCHVYTAPGCRDEDEMLDTGDVWGVKLVVTPGAKAIKCLYYCDMLWPDVGQWHFRDEEKSR